MVDDEPKDEEKAGAAIPRALAKSHIELGGSEGAIQPQRILGLFRKREDAETPNFH